jgi:toluene monooxygenase system protein A
MLKRSQWLDAARKLDWELSYVSEKEVFPEVTSGVPWLAQEEWKTWDEPYRTSFAEYVETQAKKEAALRAVQEVVGRPEDILKLPPAWLNALKLHAATLPLAEFAAVIGNLRGPRSRTSFRTPSSMAPITRSTFA